MSNSSLTPPLRPGMLVKTRAFLPHPLPHGLSTGKQVEVLQVDQDTCIVQDQMGKEWLLDIFQVDPGEYVWNAGRWEPEVAEKAG